MQDEWNLLTVQRRAYEYQHEYGISLLGKAIPGFDPADSRLALPDGVPRPAATLRRRSTRPTTTPRSSPTPSRVLNALKDVHLILAEGAHNQFGDLAVDGARRRC